MANRTLTLQKEYYTKDGRKIKGFFKLNGKAIPIVEEGSEEYYIEYNENGEILFKCSVTDMETGKRKVGFEFSSSSPKQAREDLQANGYQVTPRTLLPQKLYDHVMNETNANKWDWEDAQELFKKELKGKK